MMTGEDKVTQELRLVLLTPFSGNTCKSQIWKYRFYVVKNCDGNTATDLDPEEMWDDFGGAGGGLTLL